MAILVAPLKSILALYMEAAGEALPSGWALANGQTLTNPADSNQDSWLQQINPGASQAWVTPDLRNRHLIGGDSTIGTSTLTGAQTLPLATITVASTTLFPSDGIIHLGGQNVTYTGKTSTTFTGCTGGSGLIGDGTIVSYSGVAVGSANINSSTGAPGVRSFGGTSESPAMIATQLPLHSHSHGNRTGTTAADSVSHSHTSGSAGAHSHGNATSVGGAHSHAFPTTAAGYSGSGFISPSRYDDHYTAYQTYGTYAAGHNHVIATYNHAHTHPTDASHSHSVSITGGTTDPTGSGGTHENRPRGFGLVWIIKVRF